MDRLRALARREYGLEAEMLAHLGEVEHRRLCDHEADGSLFWYCVNVLNFTEGRAYKRIAAARAARRYPEILEMVAQGDLHVTAITLLSPHLTAENHVELLSEAVRKSKRQVKQLLAARFPRPDAPTLLRRLPAARGDATIGSPAAAYGSTAGADGSDLASASNVDANGSHSAASAPSGTASALSATASALSGPTTALSDSASAPNGTANASTFVNGSGGCGAGGSADASGGPVLDASSKPADRGECRIDANALELQRATAARLVAGGPTPSLRVQDRGSVEPLSEERFKFQVTLGRETRDKLLRAQALMRHRQPDGDLAVVLDQALSCFLEKLERAKFGKLAPRRRSAADSASDTADSASETADSASETADGASDTADSASETADNAGKAADGASKRAEQARDVARQSPAPAQASRRPRRLADGGYIPRAVKRAVGERDRCQCTYVGPDGRRCQARALLEFHHITPAARGGKASLENITLRCRSHNLADAVVDFGAEAVRRHGRRTEQAQVPLFGGIRRDNQQGGNRTTGTGASCGPCPRAVGRATTGG